MKQPFFHTTLWRSLIC